MENYDDIINLPHHVSKQHPQMPMHKRAAQFAPFAALSGYAEALRKVERENELSFERTYCEE
jgi:hypothetical protein